MLVAPNQYDSFGDRLARTCNANRLPPPTAVCAQNELRREPRPVHRSVLELVPRHGFERKLAKRSGLNADAQKSMRRCGHDVGRGGREPKPRKGRTKPRTPAADDRMKKPFVRVEVSAKAGEHNAANTQLPCRDCAREIRALSVGGLGA